MKKILVIDDAEFILESTSTLLKFEGYDVITADDGLSGVESTLQNHPDLILCDISMPGLDGYGVLEQIRAKPETATTPFIFLTAFTEKSNMRAGMEKGADDFIVKPYTRDEIIAAIDAQWQKHKLIEKQMQEKVDEVGKNVTYALPHEFRTVLNEVMNSAKYMNSSSQTIEADEIQEISSDIIASSNRLMKITENFLIYVRIESFAGNPAKKKQLRTYLSEEPAAMVHDIASLIAQKYDRWDDFVAMRMIDQIAVEISSESYHKIIDELLDNAFRFSEVGKNVAVDSWVEGSNFYLMIADEGRGMNKEQITSITALAQFERHVYEQQGVGLGLVIAKKLVELHDGTFNIESTENVGTKVVLSLPCRKLPN
jgi:two-component system, sensor histidine kinase and response regulator